MQTYNAQQVANAFFNIAEEDGECLSNMKLQKLLYFAQGMFLAFKGNPLISDGVEAWKHGPVFPRVYHEFKKYGASGITERAVYFDLSDKGKFEAFEHLPPTDEGILDFLRHVWKSFGRLTALDLSILSHEPGGPWDATMKKAGKNAEIGLDTMQDYFQARLGIAAMKEPAAA
ncbi:Panacea domain-containing protein [Dyella choica]|uniref:DUF4065 domain-containing protein n=1 Tax=Dyella choica TaxID=1927959 RepID=A0A432M0T1_9GAMM|nr:type II toxin-antitoxin system antitoxin SocA domain-containing protein [Dyella choica]RUL70535.1 DUF4065 domain-containing protein [Dyella choica]